MPQRVVAGERMPGIHAGLPAAAAETIAKIRAGTVKAMARPEVRAKLEAYNETQRKPHDEATKASCCLFLFSCVGGLHGLQHQG